MNRPAKILLGALLLAGVSAGAIRTYAAANDGATAATGQTAATEQQLAFGGDGDRPGHHGPGGPGMHGQGGPGGHGGPGFGPGPGGPDRLLDRFDANKDGSLAKAEIDTGIADQVKANDKDGDGTLSLAEYQALWLEQSHEPMVRSFQFLDRDGDGKVTDAEMKEPLDKLVQRLDQNKDGVIDQSELDRAGPGGPGGPGGRGHGGHGPGGHGPDHAERQGPPPGEGPDSGGQPN